MTSPAGARPADVEAARDLAAVALRDGYATLSTVTETDLCVLDPTDAVLVDVDAWARWMAHTDEQRSFLRRASIGMLCERKLLRPHPGAYVPQPDDGGPDAGSEPATSDYDVAPELATALLARQRPVFVGAGAASPVTSDESAPKFYGLADEASRTLTVVLEQRFANSFGRFGHEVRFMLLSPAKAAEVLISWLCVAPRSTWETGSRTFRVVTNPVGGTRVRSWTAAPVGGGWSVDATSTSDGIEVATGSSGIVDDAASMRRLTDDLIEAMNSWSG